MSSRAESSMSELWRWFPGESLAWGVGGIFWVSGRRNFSLGFLVAELVGRGDRVDFSIFPRAILGF